MEGQTKVLLIDDENDFVQTMGFWLKSKGYSVVSASNGEKGLEKIRESSPDIVFLDLSMPVMDGVETLKRIRQIKADLPVILISAYVDDQKRMNEIYSHGVSGVFYKGKDFSESLALLETALRTHKKLKK